MSNEADITLTFAGAAGTVTGSKYVIRANGRAVLLDCGLFQGLKQLRLRNWAQPPFEPRDLDAVVLSHGHLDHSGYLPVLARRGFRGPIHCTSGTADLLGVVLRDSAKLQEDDAERANRHEYSKHHPALPLYDLNDAEAALRLVRKHDYGESFAVDDDISVIYRRAGHILGSASVEMNFTRPAPAKLVFSGDLGRWNQPILRDPELVPEADVLLVESTYGDRLHATDTEEHLRRVIAETAAQGGAVIVPAFAIGRTQELIWIIRKLQTSGQLPDIPVFLDSPMGIAVTQIYCDHPEDHDLDMQALTDAQRCPLCTTDFHFVRSVEESKSLNMRQGPMIIIAGNGMATGGRVLHHLAHKVSDPRNTVLLVGYQAAGTRGRLLQDGAKTIRMHGRDIPVRARIETIAGLSAHADRDEALRWLRGFIRPPAQTYIVHGETDSAEAMAAVIRSQLGWKVDVAKDGATVSLLR